MDGADDDKPDAGAPEPSWTLSRTIGASWASAAHSGAGQTLNPPSAIARAVELGAAWAESVTERACKARPVVDWPTWPPFDDAKPQAREHAARLVAALHVHVAHVTRDPEAQTEAANARKRVAEAALTRLCYDAARTRYAELAAWRLH
jgi:hypothetical protein